MRTFGKSKDLQLNPASGCQRCPLQPCTCFAGGDFEKARSSAQLGSPSSLCLPLSPAKWGDTHLPASLSEEGQGNPLHLQALPCWRHPGRSAAPLESALLFTANLPRLALKLSTSGVLKPKTFVLAADTGHLLHCKVIFKAQQNCVLWERGFGAADSLPVL